MATGAIDVVLNNTNGIEARAAAECRVDAELRDLNALLERAQGQDDEKILKSRRDWRKIEPAEVIERLNAARESYENRQLLARAIFVGTAQALVKGSFWSPHGSSPVADEVDCKHLRRPVSRYYAADLQPPRLKVRAPGGTTISGNPNRNTLDGCADLWNGSVHRHRIAVVRFTAKRDTRTSLPEYLHCRDDQLFLRTSYYQAYEKVAVDISAPICEAIDFGGLIYTTAIGILRGPLAEGAQWYMDPPRADVLWVGLDGRPHAKEQEQYACDEDRAAAATIVDRLFAWACAHEVDALVMPPFGCGTHGCMHPYLDMADLLHDAVVKYDKYLPQLILTSDHTAHLENGWWESWEDAVRHGRPAIQAPVPLPLPARPRPAKSAAELAEKAKKLAGSGKPRGPRHTFL